MQKNVVMMPILGLHMPNQSIYTFKRLDKGFNAGVKLQRGGKNLNCLKVSSCTWPISP